MPTPAGELSISSWRQKGSLMRNSTRCPIAFSASPAPLTHSVATASARAATAARARASGNRVVPALHSAPVAIAKPITPHATPAVWSTTLRGMPAAPSIPASTAAPTGWRRGSPRSADGACAAPPNGVGARGSMPSRARSRGLNRTLRSPTR